MLRKKGDCISATGFRAFWNHGPQPISRATSRQLGLFACEEHTPWRTSNHAVSGRILQRNEPSALRKSAGHDAVQCGPVCLVHFWICRSHFGRCRCESRDRNRRPAKHSAWLEIYFLKGSPCAESLLDNQAGQTRRAVTHPQTQDKQPSSPAIASRQRPNLARASERATARQRTRP